MKKLLKLLKEYTYGLSKFSKAVLTFWVLSLPLVSIFQEEIYSSISYLLYVIFVVPAILFVTGLLFLLTIEGMIKKSIDFKINKATTNKVTESLNKLKTKMSPKILYYLLGIAIFFAAVSFFSNTRIYDTAGTAIIILTVLWIIFLLVISFVDFSKSFGGHQSQSQGVLVGWIIWAILVGLLSRCSINY